ncbi:MAG: ion transporter [bacterium]|nr:ion transporter [bacterium]
MKIDKIKYRIYEIIEDKSVIDIPSKIFNFSIIALILLNVLAIILESFQELNAAYLKYFKWFEIFSVIIFSIEYLLRVWISKYRDPDKSFISSVIKYIFTPMAMIDLFAIIPFYLPMIITIDLRFLRILRLTRLFRIFKLNRHTNSLKLIGRVLKKQKEELFITIFITFLLLLIASTLMYYIENEAQPKAFPDILSSFWWAIATLTTVGYGDVFPVTGLGKFLSGIIALLGVGIVALPTGIISSGFMDEINSKKKQEEIDNKINNETNEKKMKFCPYCGEKINE